MCSAVYRETEGPSRGIQRGLISHRGRASGVPLNALCRRGDQSPCRGSCSTEPRPVKLGAWPARRTRLLPELFVPEDRHAQPAGTAGSQRSPCVARRLLDLRVDHSWLGVRRHERVAILAAVRLSRIAESLHGSTRAPWPVPARPVMGFDGVLDALDRADTARPPRAVVPSRLVHVDRPGGVPVRDHDVAQ